MVLKAAVRSRRIMVLRRPVSCQEVVRYLDECYFCTVEGVETRLNLFAKIIAGKVGVELGSKSLFHDF